MTTGILIVDDDKDYLDSLAQFIELAGYPSIRAYSIREAHDLLEKDRFDLCLVDLHLTNNNDERDYSGFDVAIKAREMNIPIIIISGLPSVDSTREALVAHGKDTLAVDFVQKKDGPEAVLQAIHRLQGMTILHLSDLHFRQVATGEPYDQAHAYEKFLKDIQSQPGLATHPFAAIVVSGDISYKHEPESFNQAERFLRALARELKVPLEHIILSPGNHDIERQKASSMGDSLKAIQANDQSWFAKFDTFLGFTRRFYGRPAFTSQRLYRPFDLDGRVSIVAFNSCIVEGDADWRCKKCKKEHYPGWINRDQVNQAGKELTRKKWKGLRIGVFHHHVIPEDSQSTEKACRGEHLINYLDPQQHLEYVFSEQNFQILLHGHRHKADLRRSSVQGSDVPLRFGAGTFWTSLSEKDESANYLLLQLSPVGGWSRVLMRQYTPSTDERAGFWRADDTIKQGGIIPLPFIIIPPSFEDP